MTNEQMLGFIRELKDLTQMNHRLIRIQDTQLLQLTEGAIKFQQRTNDLNSRIQSLEKK